MDVRFPIGELEVPNDATLEDVKKWMNEIDSYTTRLTETVGGLNEEELAKTYRNGSFTVRQLVHHIADSQLNMYQRLRLALTDDHPTVPPFAQDEWVILADNRLPVDSSIKMLEGMNTRIVALASSLNESQLNRTFTLQGAGEISVATKLKKLYWHEEHHLAHIKIALSK
jgi:hypothetical protein